MPDATPKRRSPKTSAALKTLHDEHEAKTTVTDYGRFAPVVAKIPATLRVMQTVYVEARHAAILRELRKEGKSIQDLLRGAIIAVINEYK